MKVYKVEDEVYTHIKNRSYKTIFLSIIAVWLVFNILYLFNNGFSLVNISSIDFVIIQATIIFPCLIALVVTIGATRKNINESRKRWSTYKLEINETEIIAIYSENNNVSIGFDEEVIASMGISGLRIETVDKKRCVVVPNLFSEYQEIFKSLSLHWVIKKRKFLY